MKFVTRIKCCLSVQKNNMRQYICSYEIENWFSTYSQIFVSAVFETCRVNELQLAYGVKTTPSLLSQSARDQPFYMKHNLMTISHVCFMCRRSLIVILELVSSWTNAFSFCVTFHKEIR